MFEHHTTPHRESGRCIFEYGLNVMMLLTAVVAAKMDKDSGVQAGREFIERLRHEIQHLGTIDSQMTDVQKRILDTSGDVFEGNVEAFVRDLAPGGSLDESLGFGFDEE